MERIIKNGTDSMCKAIDQKGNSALHWAIFNQASSLPRQFLSNLLQRLPPETLAQRNDFGLTALHFALGCSQQALPVSLETLIDLLDGCPFSAGVKNQFAQPGGQQLQDLGCKRASSRNMLAVSRALDDTPVPSPTGQRD